MSEPLAETTSKRRLRRVTEASRKRSAQSCDFCRKRRCKCVPLLSGHGCVMCQSQGLECSYMLPRKTRFYGSVDDLSDRFRCLEAIVRGAFPNDAISTVPDLLQLGERMQYAMPDLSQRTGGSTRMEDLVKVPPSSSSITSAGMDTRDLVTRAPSEPPERETPSMSIARNEPRRGSSCHEGITSGVDESLGLIRDTTGREHFIGPSGSLQFLGQLRRLLLMFRSEGNSGGDGTQTPSRLTAAFTEEDAAQALETDGSQTEAAAPLLSVSPAVTAGIGDGAAGQQAIGEPSPASISSALARDYASIHFDDVDTMMKQLPPRHVLDSLLRAYFKKVHPDFPLFHRGTFEDEYENFLSGGRYPHHPQHSAARTAIPDPGWLGCLHMILAFASLIASPIDTKNNGSSSSAPLSPQDNIDLITLRHHCVSLTRHHLLPRLISRCTLSNVRALLLLSLYLHNHNERNAAWNLVGTAARASFAMGLHRSGGETHFRPVEREVRRRVFCTLFSFEQFLASSLGRPSGLFGSGESSSEEIQLVPPRGEVLDGYGQADEDDGGIGLALRLQVVLAQARVSQAVRTVSCLSSGGNGYTMDEGLALQEKSAREILRSLRDWRADIAAYHLLNIPFITEPKDILCQGELIAEGEPRMSFQELKARIAWQSRPQLRTALVLHMQYRYIAIVVTRASLLRTVASAQQGWVSTDQKSNSSPHLGDSEISLSEICVTHAVQLCRLVILANDFDLVNGISAMDVFYAYCGAMVLILRSLQFSTSTSAKTENDGEGETQQLDLQRLELRQLIARTREVLMRVDKSSTMIRFARVVATFEDASRHDYFPTNATIQVSGTKRGMGASTPILPRLRNRFTSTMPLTTDAAHVGASAAPGTSSRINASSSSSNTQGQQHASMASLDGFGAGAGAMQTGLGMGDSYFWQPNLLTSFDGEPEVNTWMMDTFLGMAGGTDGSTVVDWGDIESLFVRNLTQ